MLPRLSAPVSGVDCPCPFFHANPLLLASLLSSRNCPLLGRVVNSRLRPAPTALSAVQPPTGLSALQPPTALCWVASSTLLRVPLPLPDTARFHVQESFVWFRAKTDSSALVAYPHSATICSSLSSKLPNVGSASLPPNKAADVESNQSQLRTKHNQYQFPTSHCYCLIEKPFIRLT